MSPLTPKAKGIGLKLSNLLSPLTARSNTVRTPAWSDGDNDSNDNSTYSVTSHPPRSSDKKKSKKKLKLTRSGHRKGALNQGGDGDRKQHQKRYYSDEDSYSYSEESFSLGGDGDSLVASSYSSRSENDEYESPRKHHQKHHHRHRRQQGQRHKKKGRGRKRIESWSSSLSSYNSVLSLYIENGNVENDYLPSRREIRGLSTKALLKRCERVGINTKNIRNKGDLVDALCEYYRTRRTSMSPRTSVAANGNAMSRRKQNDRKDLREMMDDETRQMIEILQEIIPFYGQGDHQSDSIVRDTIERLPEHALELPDASGNTILLLACQSGAYDLVPLLLSRGSDACAQNNDGVASLHFTCYTDSFSPEMAQVSSS